MDEKKVDSQDIVETKDSDTEEVDGVHHAKSPKENDPGEEDRTHNVPSPTEDKNEEGHGTVVSPNASPKSAKKSKSRSKSPSGCGKKKSRRRSTVKRKKKNHAKPTSLFDGKYEGDLSENIREGKAN